MLAEIAGEKKKGFKKEKRKENRRSAADQIGAHGVQMCPDVPAGAALVLMSVTTHSPGQSSEGC